MELNAKLEEDRSLGEKLFEIETPEEVQRLLEENGMEFGIDEINELRSAVAKAVEQQNGVELSDDELEHVAGGQSGEINYDRLRAMMNSKSFRQQMESAKAWHESWTGMPTQPLADFRKE